MLTREKHYSHGFRLDERELRAIVSVCERYATKTGEPHVLDFTLRFNNGRCEKDIHDIDKVIEAGNSAQRIVSVRMTAHAAADDSEAEKLEWLIYFEFRACAFFTRKKNSYTYHVVGKDKDWADGCATTLEERFAMVQRSDLLNNFWVSPRGALLALFVGVVPFEIVMLWPFSGQGGIRAQVVAGVPNLLTAMAPFASLVVVPCIAAAWIPVYQFLWGDQHRWHRAFAVAGFIAFNLVLGLAVNYLSKALGI